jgi:hypothetical protein
MEGDAIGTKVIRGSRKAKIAAKADILYFRALADRASQWWNDHGRSCAEGA